MNQNFTQKGVNKQIKHKENAHKPKFRANSPVAREELKKVDPKLLASPKKNNESRFLFLSSHAICLHHDELNKTYSKKKYYA